MTPSGGAALRRRPPADWLRRLRVGLSRATRRWTFASRFFVVAIIILGAGTFVLTSWLASYVEGTALRAVSSTAAASANSLLAHHLDHLDLSGPLKGDGFAELEHAFDVGGYASSTRLLQVRLINPEGAVVFELPGSLEEPVDRRAFEAALAGKTTSDIRSITLPPVGPVGAHPLTVLKIVTPIAGDRGEAGPIAVAVLYFSATYVRELQFEARVWVWIIVSTTGMLVIAALYLVVRKAGETITAQRRLLTGNLAESRRMSLENRRLHAASEHLRVQATYANENLLSRVGMEIHDGPLQLLTLALLNLGQAQEGARDPKAAARLARAQMMTRDAMEEMRRLSTGLVLPELTDLTLGEAIALAIERHEARTGTLVARHLDELAQRGPLSLKICAYRIVQEALTNAVMHAGGRGQEVTASAREGRLHLEVANTRGSSQLEAAPDDRERLGLHGMKFRVEALGGVLDTDLQSAGRAVVRADIPLGPEPG